MKKTAILKNDLFLEHNPGAYHVECPERLAVIYEQLSRPMIGEQFIFPDFQPASHEMLETVHTNAHVAHVASTAGKSFASLDPDTQTSSLSYDAACLAAGAVTKGAEMVMSEEADNCFALVRPPGHHAEADRAMGFCLFNNIAVGAQYALDHLGAKRVLIMDWDLHHGNGTQHSFYDTDQVLYFSTHQFPHYPGTGSLLEVGSGAGEGYTINVPLPGGQDDRDYGQIFTKILVPIVRQYEPDLMMISAGFDIYQGDPLGGMKVTDKGFALMTRILTDLAEEVCDGRLVISLEGGYNLEGLRDGALAVLNELLGVGLTEEEYSDLLSNNIESPTIDQARNIAKNYWKL